MNMLFPFGIAAILIFLYGYCYYKKDFTEINLFLKFIVAVILMRLSIDIISNQLSIRELYTDTTIIVSAFLVFLLSNKSNR